MTVAYKNKKLLKKGIGERRRGTAVKREPHKPAFTTTHSLAIFTDTSLIDFPVAE